MRKKKLFLFDIDGTLALGNDLFDGTMDLLNYIEEIGGKAIYITNNSTKSRKDYIEKFKRWNIKTTEDDFITASYAMCIYLKQYYFNKKLFVVGTNSFIRELKEFGLLVTEEIEDDIEVLVVGFDNELNYKKIEKACKLLFMKDVEYVATNPDLCCPTPFGFIPDCGAICEMIACATQRKPKYIGKPNEIIVKLSLKLTGFSPKETLVIGDRLYTDIACGINGGVDTALVLTGEAKKEDLKVTEYVPTFCFENIKELYKSIRKII